MPRIRRLFQPPLPLRGATPDEFYVRCLGWFQPTLPLRGATVQRQHVVVAVGVVSTHAPLAGSDAFSTQATCHRPSFYPRSPCGERVSTHAPLAGNDLTSGQTKSCGCGFQPTLPLRGATADEFGVRILAVFQPTLPLRGATSSASSLPNSTGSFQPTLPLRGATAHS